MACKMLSYFCRRTKDKPCKTTYGHEHAVLGPGPEAAESETEWKECLKNPGHKNFIPVGQFGIHHLPERWKTDAFARLIKVWSGLTVRLRVRTTSPARPYFGADYGCEDGGSRVGTGTIFNAKPITGFCPCVECKRRPEAKQGSWRFEIKTALHVVYDDFEAKNTRADLFFDDKKSMADGRVKSLKVEGMLCYHDMGDWCEISCICHDDELGKWMKSQLDLVNLFDGALTDVLPPFEEPFPLVIISHPHGMPKQVTVGETSDDLLAPSADLIWYTTDTCPGSSGAWAVIGCIRYGVARETGVIHHQGSKFKGCHKNAGYFTHG